VRRHWKTAKGEISQKVKQSKLKTFRAKANIQTNCPTTILITGAAGQ
jgi:hypothetical protein